MNTYEKPLKVLVCGTNFGRVYLKGLERCGNKFKIAGIFSHGKRNALSQIICNADHEEPQGTGDRSGSSGSRKGQGCVPESFVSEAGIL